jgi:hypothetical protein
MGDAGVFGKGRCVKLFLSGAGKLGSHGLLGMYLKG